MPLRIAPADTPSSAGGVPRTACVHASYQRVVPIWCAPYAHGIPKRRQKGLRRGVGSSSFTGSGSVSSGSFGHFDFSSSGIILSLPLTSRIAPRVTRRIGPTDDSRTRASSSRPMADYRRRKEPRPILIPSHRWVGLPKTGQEAYGIAKPPETDVLIRLNKSRRPRRGFFNPKAPGDSIDSSRRCTKEGVEGHVTPRC